jgi:hypothetical protein
MCWTDLNPARLAKELVAKGYEIGRNTAARLLEWGGYRRRALRKALITGSVDPHERDQQFQQIARLRHDAHAHHQPLVCVDTKKKEPLGTVHRPGRLCCTLRPNGSMTMMIVTWPVDESSRTGSMTPGTTSAS